MISTYTEDIVDYILKNSGNFEHAMKRQIRFGYDKYSINIVKSDKIYHVYIYHNSESIHDLHIDENTYRYDEIKIFIDAALIKFDKAINNEQLLVKLLGKDSRRDKIKKIKKKINK
jgi:hypothetical protein